MSYQLTDDDVRELQRIRRKLENITFVGMAGRTDGETIVIGPPQATAGVSAESDQQQDTGQYQGMVKQMVSQNQAGWGFVIATPVL